MCWSVYIATSKPLKNVLFSKDLPKDGSPPPPLHFEETTDAEDEANGYRPLFKGQHLYYVGSNTGCGCALERSFSWVFDGEEMIKEYDGDDASPLAFFDFIKNYTQQEESLEMYVVWETDRRTEPLEKVIVNVLDMTMDTYFK